MRKPALFLDRDGTLIKDNGYIKDIKKVVFYPFTFDALRELQKKYLLFIVTNQAGVGKGLITMQEMESVNHYILDQLQKQQIHISKVYICPHKKEDLCDCRKPKPYFIDQACNECEIDLSQSFVIGDHPSDMELGINRNVKGIYLLTGHGRKHYKELETLPTNSYSVYKSLPFFVKSIHDRNHSQKTIY